MVIKLLKMANNVTGNCRIFPGRYQNDMKIIVDLNNIPKKKRAAKDNGL